MKIINLNNWVDDLEYIDMNMKKDDVIGITTIIHVKDACIRHHVTRRKDVLSLEMVLGRMRMFELDLIKEFGNK